MSYNSGLIEPVISNESPDYSLNCTPLSPITITNYYIVIIYLYELVVKPVQKRPELSYHSLVNIINESHKLQSTAE